MKPFRRQEIALSDLKSSVRRNLDQNGWRFGHMTAREIPDGNLALEVLLLDTINGSGLVLSAPIPEGTSDFPTLTQHVPAAHWAERAIGDFFALKATDHPRWKSLILHEAWPAGLAPLRSTKAASPAFDPYQFMEVQGEGVHEIPVGPIHAGIIEPGHFRFSCLGEIVSNLEIRLGYQHRGIEQQMTQIPWQKARFHAEAVSSDTTIGNALAHAIAIEQMLNITAPPRARVLRTIALEIERVATHVGDLGGLSGDIGYSVGAALYSRLRGSALGVGEIMTGTRFQRAYITPGGVSRDLSDANRTKLVEAFSKAATEIKDSLPLLLENPTAIERMEGTGRLSPSLAKEFGIVGPAGRASGSAYDTRTAFPQGIFPSQDFEPAKRETGDVLARAQIRAEEIASSLSIISELLENLPDSPIDTNLPDKLPSNATGVGIVEAWRGELIHWITTDQSGRINRYAIKDPSFNNWTGLSIAVRGNLVSDFPLCNKSFNLSYSGNDL